MYLSHLHIKDHPILKDFKLNLINPKTNEAYSIIAFVGENGCGKTTLLNEIFNYVKSEYIYDKQTPYGIVPKPFDALFLRQGSLHKNAMKEVGKLIDGKDMYPINSAKYEGGSNPFSLRSNNAINRVDRGVKLLERLGDDEITEIFKENHIAEVYCSTDVSKKIDGMDHGYNITNYSSGQQEILLKLKDLKAMANGTDCVLLDEPETSLHPRWQKEIVNLIEQLLEAGGMVPQIFLATHSEKVLESLICRDDVLIVRLFKDSGEIKTETIGEMDLCLPKTTFAELDYAIFKIDNYEYCSQLYDLLEWKYGNPYQVDKKILASEFYEKEKHYKPWYNDRTRKTEQFALPTYVRNYFHHPKDREEPTLEELHEAIILLRKVVLNFK